MKKYIILIITLALFSSPFAAPKTYDVAFKNISMKEFITFVSSFAEVNIIYNELDLRGTVNIASQYPMTAAAIMEIFYATLRVNGLAAIQEGDNILVVADKDFVNYDERFTGDTSVDGEEFVTAIVTMTNYNIVPLKTALQRVKSRHGDINDLKGINGVVVRDFGSRIEKMRDICRKMDEYASKYNLYSISLQSIAASKMEQLLTKMFNDMLNRQNVGGYPPVFISDDLSNVIIIAAIPSDYKKIEYVISQIDIKSVSENTLPRVFYIKYAQAEDIEKVLNKIFGGGTTSASGTGGGAPPGTTRPVGGVTRTNVSSDKSTNSIIALGDTEFYNNLEKMIEKLDIPRKQVYVEALILETSLDATDKFGVEWFLSGADDNVIGFGNSASDGALGGIFGSIAGGTGNPVTGLPGGFSAGLIGDVITYNGIKFPSIGAFFSAIQEDSGVNIVSKPQILTLDNEEAEVFVGETRPYITSEKYDTNNNPIQTFDYRNVGTRLKVTPHIVGDDLVNLEIEQEVNKVSPSSFSNASPVTLTRTTKTRVQLYDKTIMVIGGLMKDDSSSATTGIPFLSSIPILGWLFKTETETSEKTNLMVFITVHIINTKEEMGEVLRARLQNPFSAGEKIENLPEDIFTEELYGVGEE
ncbi:MAG: type II secretion system secretin GspD [Deferribacteraceae bacterium]|jgi:general secretion pathway protein D|nr:type II secretion system secretin GspD [Deferribacteraceae bacterium]